MYPIAFIPGFVGDNAHLIIGILIVVASIGWLRRPLWRLTKAGLGSMFGGDNEPVYADPEPAPKAPKAPPASKAAKTKAPAD